MNLQTMWHRLRLRIGSPSETDVPNTTLTDIINSSQLDIFDRYRFHRARKRCRFTTVIGQARYDLPLDVLAVLRVSDETNRRKLEKWGDRQLSSRIDDEQAMPLYYVRYRDWIELNPIPDGEYVIEVFYKYQNADLVNPTDVPGLPLSWHEGIIVYGEYIYYMYYAHDKPKAALAHQAWKVWVQDKPTEIDEESVDIDSGVEILPLSHGLVKRLDFDHGP